MTRMHVFPSSAATNWERESGFLGESGQPFVEKGKKEKKKYRGTVIGERLKVLGR